MLKRLISLIVSTYVSIKERIEQYAIEIMGDWSDPICTDNLLAFANDTIAHLERHVKKLDEAIAREKQMRCDAERALDNLLGEITVPDKNCTCFLNPPCGDCTDNEPLRTFVIEAQLLLERHVKLQEGL